jgi:flagellar assembly protein FliH
MKDILYHGTQPTHPDGPQPVDLASVLAQVRNPVFKRENNAPGKVETKFRLLSWAKLAIKIPLESEPAEEQQVEPDHTRPSGQENTLLDETTSLEGQAAELGDDKVASAVASDSTTAMQSPELIVPAPPPAPVMDEVMIQKIRDEAYDEGLSAGKAMTESEREAELATQFIQLQQLMTALNSADVLDIEAVANSIEDAVMTLASERIGMALTDMTEPLARRLETLLDSLAHLIGIREVFVAPEDMSLMQRCIDEHPNPPALHLRSDPSMQRGDARLRVGGAEIADLLRDQAPSVLAKKIVEAV